MAKYVMNTNPTLNVVHRTGCGRVPRRGDRGGWVSLGEFNNSEEAQIAAEWRTAEAAHVCEHCCG